MKTNCTLLIGLFFLLSSFGAGAQTSELFNGKDLSGWKLILKDNSKKPEEVFTVREGVIRIAGEPFGYMHTAEKYENFSFYAEWRWPENPGNSGIFFFIGDEYPVWPNAIECQLMAGKAGDMVLLNGSHLDEYRTPPGQERPAFPVLPKFQADSEKPAGEWNNAFICCKDGRISIFINGVWQNQGSGYKNRKGHIALQSEGSPIEFRNIRVTAE